MNAEQAALEAELARAGRLIPATPAMIFVFGSNESGVHGAGAARFAFDHRGAKMGLSFGPSRKSFAIPTKDANIRYTLPLDEINAYVRSFLAYAAQNPKETFQVTRIGCGLAGLKDDQIAPMFSRAPGNCLFDTGWRHWCLRHNYWGTFP